MRSSRRGRGDMMVSSCVANPDGTPMKKPSPRTSRPLLAVASLLIAASAASCSAAPVPSAVPQATISVREGDAVASLGSLTGDFQVALRLSEENPDDFGYPYLTGGRIRLPLVSERAQALANAAAGTSKSALTALRAAPLPQGMLKRTDLTDADVTAFDRFDKAKGSRTFSQSMADKDRAMDVATRPEFQDLRPSMSYVDLGSGRVVLVVEQNSTALDAALAKVISPDSIEIHLAKRGESGPA